MHDDDVDPVDEIRAFRAKTARKYKTLDAYFTHLATLPSPEEMHARIKMKLAKGKPSSARRPVSRKVGKSGVAALPTAAPRRRRKAEKV